MLYCQSCPLYPCPVSGVELRPGVVNPSSQLSMLLFRNILCIVRATFTRWPPLTAVTNYWSILWYVRPSRDPHTSGLWANVLSQDNNGIPIKNLSSIETVRNVLKISRCIPLTLSGGPMFQPYHQELSEIYQRKWRNLRRHDYLSYSTSKNAGVQT